VAIPAGRLEGKIAVVVGAGQTPGETIGNGRATAVRFAQEGASLLLVDRHEASLEAPAELSREAGAAAEVLVGDVVGPDLPDRLVTAADKAFGRIDVLHLNVGIGAGDSSPTRLSEEAWDRIMDVNLKATWRTAKAVVPGMRQRESGSVVFISSLAAIAAAGNLTAYKVSKAGVNALVQGFAVTSARFGVRVNGIMPGFIDTPMAVDAQAAATGASRADVADPRHQAVPLRGRMGTAWDVANAALFLASDEAAFITGVVLPVDGGQSARVG
jgi:NAD(P)-dependent dehydrogenase (short-subunit alcohol dehydrogenase family)